MATGDDELDICSCQGMQTGLYEQRIRDVPARNDCSNGRFRHFHYKGRQCMINVEDSHSKCIRKVSRILTNKFALFNASNHV